MSHYSHIKAVAFDHYGTLFNKQAVGEMIDQEFPGHGSEEEIGFVSGNSFDVVGSASFGYPTFWINRTSEPLDVLGLEPDLIVSNLDELADALDG